MTTKDNVEITSLAVIESKVLNTEVAGPNGPLVQLSGNRLEIRGMDEFRKNAASALESIMAYEYTDDDRQAYKKLRAAFNKLSKQVGSAVLSAQRELMAQASLDRSEVESTLSEIIAALDNKVKETEDRMREERLSEISDAFENALTLLDGLDGLTLDDVMVSSWMNISTSMKSVQNELAEKLQTISKLISSGHVGNRSPKDVAAALDYVGGDALDVISFFKRQDEAEALAKQSASQIETLDEEKTLKRLMVVIPSTDVESVIESIKSVSPEASIVEV